MQEHGAGSWGHLGAGTSHQSRSEPGSISTGFGVSWWWCGEGRGRRGARLGADPEHRVLSGRRRHAWAGTELCSVAPWRWKQPASRGSPGLCAEGGRLGGRGTGTREPLGGAGGGVMTATNKTEACARRSPEPLAGGARRSVTGELILASVTCVTGTARGVRAPSGGPRGPDGRGQAPLWASLPSRGSPDRPQRTRWLPPLRRAPHEHPSGPPPPCRVVVPGARVFSVLVFLEAVAQSSSPVPLQCVSAGGEAAAARHPLSLRSPPDKRGLSTARGSWAAGVSGLGLTQQALRETLAPARCRACRFERRGPP